MPEFEQARIDCAQGPGVDHGRCAAEHERVPGFTARREMFAHAGFDGGMECFDDGEFSFVAVLVPIVVVARHGIPIDPLNPSARRCSRRLIVR